MEDEVESSKLELLERPREYIVVFTFPNPPELPPPILGLHDVSFRYSASHEWLFENLEFGIDMNSRVVCVD